MVIYNQTLPGQINEGAAPLRVQIKALLYDAESRRVAGVYSAPLEMLSDNTGKREQLAEWWQFRIDANCLPGGER